jgi:hypothetical protein
MSGPERHKNWFSTLLNATTSARPKRRLKDKIKMNFGEVGCEDGRWMKRFNIVSGNEGLILSS